MPFTNAGKVIALDAIGAVAVRAALYTDNAATVEVAGGVPAYARQVVSWDPAVGDQADLDVAIPPESKGHCPRLWFLLLHYSIRRLQQPGLVQA